MREDEFRDREAEKGTRKALRQAEEERRRVVVAESQVASDEWKEASRYEIAEAAIEYGMEWKESRERRC